MLSFYDKYYLDKLLTAIDGATMHIAPTLEERELNKTGWFKNLFFPTPKQKASAELVRCMGYCQNYLTQTRRPDNDWTDYRNMYFRTLKLAQQVLESLSKSEDFVVSNLLI